MKKGYKRLLVFSISLMMILFMNTFLFHFLSSYKMILFLIFLLIIFNEIFIIEKDHHMYMKDIAFETVMYTLTFFMIYYLLGLLIGLARTPNYLTILGMIDFIIPITLTCIFLEVFRYNMLCKAEGNILCTIVVTLLIITFHLTNPYYYANLNSSHDRLSFIALTVLPVISRDISYTYISKKMGYKPVIIFDLIFSLYMYILPLIPNLNEYLTAILYLLTPVLYAFRILKFFTEKEDHQIPSDYKKKRLQGSIVPIGIILIMIYFYSGYFRFYAIAIASGSMSPKINKGDVVIVDQKYSYKDLEIGQVIAYKKNNIIVVHRIEKKLLFGNSYLYYTKGDANHHIDDFVIEEDMIVGKVDYKIPYIGYPTIWINTE